MPQNQCSSGIGKLTEHVHHQIALGIIIHFCMSVTLERFYIISMISVAMHIKDGGLGTQPPQ